MGTQSLPFSSLFLVICVSLNTMIVTGQDMNMNEVIKEEGYMEIKDRSKVSAGADSLRIRIPPKSSGKEPEFKYRVQAQKGKPPVEISIEPDAPIAVGESLDWNKASDMNKNSNKIQHHGK